MSGRRTSKPTVAYRPVTYRREALAAVLCISTDVLDRWDSSGKVPQPAVLSGMKFWNAAEIQHWVDAGMPDRASWAEMKAAQQ